MKTIIAIIEKGDDGGYGIYALDDSIPVVGDGMTEEEARNLPKPLASIHL